MVKRFQELPSAVKNGFSLKGPNNIVWQKFNYLFIEVLISYSLKIVLTSLKEVITFIIYLYFYFNVINVLKHLTLKKIVYSKIKKEGKFCKKVMFYFLFYICYICNFSNRFNCSNFICYLMCFNQYLQICSYCQI